MQLRSFEEELNKKAAGFSLTPREGLWEDIELQLVPEKRNRRAVWLWLPIGLSVLGAFVYLGNKESINAKQSISKNAGPHKTVLSSVHENENLLSVNGKVLKDVKSPEEQSIDHSTPHNPGRMEKDDIILAIGWESLNENAIVQNGNNQSPEINAMQSADVIPPLNSAIVNLDISNAKDNVTESDLMVKTDDTLKKNTIAVPVQKMYNAGKFYLGVMISGIYSKSILTMGRQSSQSTNVNGSSQMDYNNRKETDKSIPGFGIGVNGGYIKGRHHFYSGLYYQMMGYQLLVKNVEREVHVWNSAVTNKTSFVATDSFASTDKVNGGVYFTNRFHYLSIPVGYAFNVIDKAKFGIGLTGSFSYNLLLSSSVLLYDEQSNYYMKQENIKDSKLMKSNFMMAFGCDLSYRLNERCALTLRPQYGFSLNPVEKTAINTGLRYFGLGLGVRYFLK